LCRRQQLDCVDAQVGQVRELGDRVVESADLVAGQLIESADVNLVDD
jgi:hypothetical protein